MSFFAELRRRNVVKVGAAYLIVAWLLIQVASTVLPTFDAPRWAVQTLTFVVILGFPIALALAWVYELTPEGVKRTVDVPAAQSITPTTGQRLNYVIIGALALALGFVVLDNYVLDDSASDVAATDARSAAGSPAAGAAAEGAKPSTVSPPVARAVLPNSVAVLPFVNMSPSEHDAYFAAGIHEEILNYLAKLSELNVISRTSMLRYADTDLSMREIAAELNVETIMEGSVRYAGDEVRITAQLIDPLTGAHLWSEAYQRKIDDIFAIQADIAMNIANAIGAEFSTAEQATLETPPTSSPAAYALYLQAVELGRIVLPGQIETALALLDRAIELDPEFARAYAQKASFYAVQFVNSNLGAAAAAGDRATLEQRVRENVERALALDPRDLTARMTLRSVNVITWRWADFAESLDAAEERALQALPLWALSWMGNHADAVRIAQKITELNPNSAGAHVNLGVVQAYAGDRAASSRSVQQGLDIGADNLIGLHWLAYNAAALGDADEALAHLQLFERLLGDNRALVYLPELAYAYSRIGRSDDVARLFAELQARSADADVGVGTWAMAYLAVGDEEESRRYLEAAAEKARNHAPDAGFLALMQLKMNILADPRLEEPRFAEVLSRIRGD
jgi:TolB-like protein/Flp pilus assembly protein TadD